MKSIFLSYIRLIAIIAGTNLGIQGVLAMEPTWRESTPQGQASITEQGDISPAVKRHVSFDPSLDKSPSKTTERLVNFYKICVHALRDGKLNEFETALFNFFGQIPHNLKINDVRFYKALFFTIASLFGKTYFLEANDSYYLFLTTEEGRVFILEFRVHDSNASESTYTPIKFVPNSEKEVEPINIIKIIANTAQKDVLTMRLRKHGKSETIYSIKEKTFKQPMYSCNNPLRNIQSAIEHLNGGHTHDQIKMLSTITASFNELYNSIPVELHMPCEKFYQSLFVCLMIFVRSGSIDQEVRSLIGRSDAVIITPTNTCIIEFKHKGSADEAIQQIIDKRYCLPYHESNKPIWMLGINIDKYKRTTTKLVPYSEDSSPRRSSLPANASTLHRLTDLFE